MSHDLGKYRLFFDGACSGNPGPGGAGFYIVDPFGLTIDSRSVFLGDNFTNNRAEYMALILGLTHLAELHLSDLRCVEIVSDSKLVVQQVRGACQIRNKELKELRRRVRELLDNIGGDFEICFLPRKYNRCADRLAREALE